MSPLEIHNDLCMAVDTLCRGGIVLYPTDTIWGLGCDATDESAVRRLFELKHRPDSKAMISLVDSLPTLRRIVPRLPLVAEEEFLKANSPLTIIVDHASGIAESLKAEDGSAAFRIPLFHFTNELCRLLGRPLVSTSVNISGQAPARSFDDISEEMKEKVDYVCRFGRDLKSASPSRIIKIGDDGQIDIIRD